MPASIAWRVATQTDHDNDGLPEPFQMTNYKQLHRSPLPFNEAITPYLRACPGPAIAEKGLRIMAYQYVPGISGLKQTDGAAPFRSVKDIAKAVCCSPGHLSRVALDRGYSFGLAVRWITLLQGIALRQSGCAGKSVARRLGFSDAAGWTRFTRRLIGKTPSQLPHMPVEDWAVVARAVVFLAPYRSGSKSGMSILSLPTTG